MADFTETPHAEDFAYELGELIDSYAMERGLSTEWIARIMQGMVEDMVEELD